MRVSDGDDVHSLICAFKVSLNFYNKSLEFHESRDNHFVSIHETQKIDNYLDSALHTFFRSVLNGFLHSTCKPLSITVSVCDACTFVLVDTRTACKPEC